MIQSTQEIENLANVAAATTIYLVRYGAVPEVTRCLDASTEQPARGAAVVIETDRGLQLGTVLERLKPNHDPSRDQTTEFRLVRVATDADLQTSRELATECERTYAEWCGRIHRWNLEVELVDLEWTLDRQKLILYILCERGPDSTKLALQAAAEGLGVIEVQPVSAQGQISLPAASCGSGGGQCGCHH